MIVVPIESSLDWRRPPVVTVLLILINVWIFFALAGPDKAALIEAEQIYTENDLLKVDGPAFRVFAAARDEELPEDDDELVYYVFTDIEFDAYLRASPPPGATREWRVARDRFEAQRNDVSWIVWGLIPAQPRWATFFTSMYLHGGIWHLLGNMAFLFMFGFSLERALGRMSYFLIYHATGLFAGLLVVLVDPDSHTPGIGASGAISGLMGAYLAVYRLRKIRFFYNFLVYFGEFKAPALWIFPFWLAKELYGNFFGAEGVLYWAHIGGLLAGVAGGLGFSFLSKTVDVEYLEENERNEARAHELARLDTLIDEFKFDQAKALASRILQADPTDLSTWSKYMGLLRTDPDQPEYHTAVMAVAKLAPKALTNPAIAEFVEQTYRAYREGDHPKPALKNATVLFVLARVFTRMGYLESAQQIAETLLQANKRPNEELNKLIMSLANQLQSAGEELQASRYRALLDKH
ncbi:MAG: rhomboid family intramembrane serine protease [Gammaproteobacteria bacterium]|nr:rhomboid family intramembrane serine protease [Gammaproteobacteria bacterium]